MQGKGIGKELLSITENYLLSHSIDTIIVPTQKNNKPAMSFYRKMGFKELETQNIYHFIK
jgi:ribosomal protein S18 acetylase RimI-like enzyme